MKFIENLIELVYWVWIFLCPTAVCGFIGFVIYCNYNGLPGIASFIVLSALGAGLGIFFAEKIRRTVGCANFITRRTPWPRANRKEKN